MNVKFYINLLVIYYSRLYVDLLNWKLRNVTVTHEHKNAQLSYLYLLPLTWRVSSFNCTRMFQSDICLYLSLHFLVTRHTFDKTRNFNFIRIGSYVIQEEKSYIKSVKVT